MRVVIGAGADGTRAAAALAATGEAVLLLQATETPHGLDHPDLPEGTGRMAVGTAERAAVEAVTGPLVEAPRVSRAVALGGRVSTLPMKPTDAIQLFDVTDRVDAGRSFMERRVRNALIPITGEGQEERTYRQWVERRMGASAYQHVYADYAQKRWCLPGDRLSVAVARQHHNPHHGEPTTVAGGGAAAALDNAIAVIESNGGEIRCGVNVRGIKVVDGRAAAVRVGRRNIPVDGDLWVARPHTVVAGWLGDSLARGPSNDSAFLHVWDRLQVAFDADKALPADELHILDRGSPAWRVSQVYGSGLRIVFHANVAPDTDGPDLLSFVALGESLGIRGLRAENARVERLREWVPVWAPVVHPRLRRLSLAFAELGIVSVGRRGTFSPLDAGTELALAARYAAEGVPDQREALRALLEPPAKDPDLDASFRDFLWR